MKYEFISIPALDPAKAQGRLNQFVAQHRVVQVDRHFTAHASAPFWAVCISYVEGDAPAGPTSGASARRAKVDYREVLSPEDFVVFVKLREVRKAEAAKAGVPLYSVFNNEHLAEMVRQRMGSKADLGSLANVGEARLDKYAEPFVQALQAAWRGEEKTRDPKPRVIHAPIFEDRVAHHALIAVIGPALDAALIDDTFACRVGKGSLAAVHRAQHFVRRHDWYVKIDIRKYFASLPHERLISALHRKLADAGTRQLVEHTIRGFEATPGHGLPIGALTSQHFANYYLGQLDRIIFEQPEVRGLVRYMDDVIWWCGSRAAAQQTLQQVRDFVPAELGLTLKGPGFVQRSRAGLSFLGFRIYPGTLKLSRRRKRRYRAARRKWESLYLMGHITSLELQRGYEAALATTAHADALGFRRADLKLRPAPDA